MDYFSIEIILEDAIGNKSLNSVNSVLGELLDYITPSVCDELLIAIHELLINSYKELRLTGSTSEKRIFVSVYVLTHYVYAEICDSGKPLAYSTIQEYIENTHESDCGEERGRGLAMVKMLCDILGYYYNGNSNVFYLVCKK